MWGKKHNKQTCPVAKKQRMAEFQAQQNQPAPAAPTNGPAPAAPTNGPAPAAPTNGPAPATSTNGPAPAASANGPSPTPAVPANGPAPVVPAPTPDEIDLSQSQPPPINLSPTKTHNMTLRPKLQIRGKGAAAQPSPRKGDHLKEVHPQVLQL
ncbi:putative titin-like [Sesbania bispinosa]|nr:putative titin-like [Sesbania bispinosa]